MQFRDRVWDVSASSGLGTFSVAGTPPLGYVSYGSVLADGDQVYYCIVHRADGTWEVGEGTYSAATLSRDVVKASTAAGAKVDFATGPKDVMLVAPAAWAAATGTGTVGPAGPQGIQ